MAQRKFGLRSVRVPWDVVYELHEEYNERATSSPFRYSVRRVTTAEARVHAESYAVYLCNAHGRRLPGADTCFFTIYYPRRKRQPAPTAPTPTPTGASPDPDLTDEEALEVAGRDASLPEDADKHDGIANPGDAMDSGRRPSGVAVETGVPDDVMAGNADDCNPQV